jgi:hypothetical protein
MSQCLFICPLSLGPRIVCFRFLVTSSVFGFWLPLLFSSYLGARLAQWVRSLDLTAHTSLSPIRRGFAPSFVNYKKGFTRPAVASDKFYQLLAQCWWFSLGTPASSTTKTGCHDIAEILLKVVLKHQKSNQIFILIWELALYFCYIVLQWFLFDLCSMSFVQMINISAIFRTGTSLKYIYKNYIEMREWTE